MINQAKERAQSHREIAMGYADLIMQGDGLGFYLGMMVYGLPYYYNVMSANFYSFLSKK